MPSRRDFLGAASLGAAATALGGCDSVLGAVSRRLGADVPDRIVAPSGPQIDDTHHLLDRAAFGPWPGDVERVKKLGAERWIDEQLDPESIGDAACRVRTAVIDTVHLPSSLLFEVRPKWVEKQLVTHTLLQAIYSKRQLKEVMVSFWTDHFNIAIGKSLCRHLKTGDDRDVIRQNALGSFRRLLGASAKSAAMLVYLDGRDNKKSEPEDRPNENYARELLELHTLGVRGGYTQNDVMEAARCLTGWVVREKWAPGTVEFDAKRHDDGKKIVLGKTIAAGGGAKDVDSLLDVLVAHPACGRFLAQKLCRFFVADDPPRALVERVAAAFESSGGDIPTLLRTILTSVEFRGSKGQKLKRPFRYVVSSLRALGADAHARGELQRYLERMGHKPFQYPTPDGYPNVAGEWLATMLWRWNFALALAEGRLGDAKIDVDELLDALGADKKNPVTPVMRHLLGRDPTPAEREALEAYLASEPGQRQPRRALALALASPAFQRH